MKYTECPDCQSGLITWAMSVITSGSAPDGRLRLGECYPVAYQYCEECSWTGPLHRDIVDATPYDRTLI